MQWLKDNNTNTSNDRWLFLVSLIISAMLLFVCSANSIIYPMSDYVDENVFFSVTDSMFHGYVLYKDIFEHKGPFLYLVIYSLLHILGNSYFSLYILECITNALFVYFTTKTILLYDTDASKLRIFLYSVCLEFCLCTSTTFTLGGVPEEIFLWMSSYGLYTTLRCLKCGEYYSHKELVLIGLLCGATFWTKYAMLGFYSGLAIYVVGWNITQKNLARLGKTIMWFLSGFAISCVPTVIYCGITHSFMDMINVYFIGNVFGKHITSSMTAHIYLLMEILYKDIGVAALIMLGVYYILKEEKNSVRWLVALTILSTFMASCCLKTCWYYYPIPMLAFTPLGVVAFKELKIKLFYKIIIIAVTITFFLHCSLEFGLYSPNIGDELNPVYLKEQVRVLAKAGLAFFILFLACSKMTLIPWKYKGGILGFSTAVFCTLLGYGVRDPVYFHAVRDPNYLTESPFPQFQFAKTIKKTPNASILIFKGYDFGFFKISQTYPQVKYFNNLNLVAPDIEKEQYGYIKNEVVDYIITTQKKNVMDAILEGTSYQLVDTSDNYIYREYEIIFFLYKKQTLEKYE